MQEQYQTHIKLKMYFEENYSGYQPKHAPMQQWRGRGLSRSRGRGRQPQTKARKEYQDNRMTQFREKKEGETMRKDEQRIKSELLIGVSEEEALKKLAETQALRSLTLSITTREIGMGTCHLFFIARHYHNNIILPDIYRVYRAFLGILEAKLESLKAYYPVVARNTEHIYSYQVDANFLRIAQTVTVAPEPLRRVIDAVGIVKHSDKIYIPAVATRVFNRNGAFVPRQESLLLTNLMTMFCFSIRNVIKFNNFITVFIYS